MTQATPQPSTRDCNGCTLCCKVLQIAPLEKPANVLCRHCTVGTGCGIYPDRPQVCRTFLCGYLSEPSLGPEWWPATSKMVLTSDGPRMVVAVDPDEPDAWRREPYYSALRHWARAGAPHGATVTVMVGDAWYRVMANGEVKVK